MTPLSKEELGTYGVAAEAAAEQERGAARENMNDGAALDYGSEH